MDAAPDGILLVDHDGTIVLANGQAEALFGYEAGELLGSPLAALVSDPRVGPDVGFAAVSGRRKDGSAVALDVSASVRRSPTGDVTMVVVRDLAARHHAEEQMARLAAIVAGSDDAIFSQDAAGSVTSWNRGATRLYGYTGDEVLGRPPRMLANPEAEREHAALIERVLAGEQVDHLEAEHRRADGMAVQVALSVSPIHNDSGVIDGTSAIARDITEQVLAQAALAASEERLREGEALAHVGSWSIDRQTGAVQWSAELHTINGLDPLQFQGTLDEHIDVVHPDDRHAMRTAILGALDAAEPFELTHRIAGDRRIYARGAPVLGARGEVVGIRGISRDVTEAHRASEAMLAAYERERRAAEELRLAAAMKDDFLSIVSHELRTPLTSIVGFSALLDVVGDDERPDLAQRIVRNAAEMQRMVERLLDFTRLQSGAVHLLPTTLHLREEIEHHLQDLEGLLEAHRVSVDVADDLRVFADRDALNHVVGNLLTNAAKFAPAGTAIEIRGERDDAMVVVSVRDEGPGVDPAVRDKIFDRFFQAAPAAAGRRGAGVGLAIVRDYVQLQGGRAWCDGEPGQGSTFRFTVPLGSSGT